MYRPVSCASNVDIYFQKEFSDLDKAMGSCASDDNCVGIRDSCGYGYDGHADTATYILCNSPVTIYVGDFCGYSAGAVFYHKRNGNSIIYV